MVSTLFTNLYLQGDFLEILATNFCGVIIVEVLLRSTLGVNVGAEFVSPLVVQPLLNVQDGYGLLHHCIGLGIVIHSVKRCTNTVVILFIT